MQSIFRYFIILVAGALLASCASKQSPEIGTRPVTDMQDMAARSYLSVFPNVGIEEARRRMSGFHQAEINTVQRCAIQLGSFAGMALQHIPTYQIRLYFVGDAQAELNKCTHNSEFVAYSADYTNAELYAAFKLVNSELTSLEQAAWGDYSIELNVNGHRANGLDAVDEHGIDEEGYIKIIAIDTLMESIRGTDFWSSRQYPFVYLFEGVPEYDEVVETAN